MDRPSGLQAGCVSDPGFVVICRSVCPRSVLSAATIQMSLLEFPSASSVRLLTNATNRPLGLHTPSDSSVSPDVIWVSSLLATSKT